MPESQRGVQFRIVISPVIVFFLVDFSGFHFYSHLLPCMKRVEQMLIFFVLPVKSEVEFSVNFSDLNAIHIFHCKEGVHETEIEANVRNIDGSGAKTEDLCYFFDQVSFRDSGFCLVLRHMNIRSLSKESKKFAKSFCFIPFLFLKNLIRFPNAIGVSPFSKIFYSFLKTNKMI